MKMILTFLLPLLAAGIANNSVPPSLAATGQQAQEVNSSGGDLFMEEVTPATAPKVRPPTARARILDSNGNVVNPAAGKSMQSVQDKGGIFMQEVDTPPQGEKRRAYVDLSNVGVQVDPSGNAVPLINHSGLPVRPLYSNTQAFQEMPVPTILPTPNNPNALPYTMDGQPAPVNTSFIPVTPGSVPFLQPSFNPYNGMATLNPYSARPYGFSPYPAFAGGYPGQYGGFGGGGINFNVGKLHVGLGQGYGYPGNGYPGYGYPGYGSGMGSGFGSGFGFPNYAAPGYGNAGFGGLGLGNSGFGGLGMGRSAFGGFGSGILGGGFNPGFGYLPTGANPAYGYNPGFGTGYGYLPGYGYGYGNSYSSGINGYNTNSIGRSLALPLPTERTYTSESGTSSLIAPVLRDPATSTGDLLEDAKRAGLWSNSKGNSSFSRGPFGGMSGSSSGQDTGVTEGAGMR